MAVDPKSRDRWHALNAFIAKRGGIITSLPMHWPIIFETSADTTLPGELQALGYTVKPIGTVRRLRPHATRETLITGRSSAPEYTISMSHAGIVELCQWELTMPPLHDMTRAIPGEPRKKPPTRIYQQTRREKLAARARA